MPSLALITDTFAARSSIGNTGSIGYTSNASVPFDGGTLLVTPVSVSSFNLPFGAASTFSLPINLPLDPMLCGVNVYFQFMIVDPGASGFYHTAQTKGLHWTIGW